MKAWMILKAGQAVTWRTTYKDRIFDIEVVVVSPGDKHVVVEVKHRGGGKSVKRRVPLDELVVGAPALADLEVDSAGPRIRFADES